MEPLSKKKSSVKTDAKNPNYEEGDDLDEFKEESKLYIKSYIVNRLAS